METKTCSKSPKNREEGDRIFTVATIYLDKIRRKVGDFQSHPPCLCQVLSPLLFITSFFGLFPVTLSMTTKTRHTMSHKWISRRGIANLLWLTSISITSLFLYKRVMTFFRAQVVNGTDFYTFGLVFLVQIASTVVIFLCGNVKGPKFAQAWNSFHHVVNSVRMENFCKFKLQIYLIPVFVLEEIVVNVIAGIWIHFHNLTQDRVIVALIPLSGFVVTFIPGLLTCSFVVILWILAEHFKIISERVQKVVDEVNSTRASSWKKNELENKNLAEKVIKLRCLHEELSIVVRNVEDAFGIQILAIFAATSFGFVAGVYGLIVFGQGLNEIDGDGISKMAASYSLANVFGGLRLLLILSASQYLMNRAKAPAEALNGLSVGLVIPHVQTEVDRFLAKLGNFPVQIRCFEVFTLGNCFMAAAASNAVTYVLVLMQFRFDKCNLTD